MSTQEKTGSQMPKPSSGKYANQIYGDFCMASAKQLNLVPIDMGYGDPASDKFIPKELLRHFLDQLHNKNAGAYPDVKGDINLINKFKEFIKNDEGLSYDYDLAVVSGGGRSAITNILSIFLKPKDIVLIPYPAWSGYKSLARFVDAIIYPITTTMKKRFIPSAADIESAIAEAKKSHSNSNVKLMILNTPHNPTGSVYSSDSIREILQILHKYGIACLADYTYRAIREKGTPMQSVHKVAEDIEFEGQLPKGTFTDSIVAMQTIGKVSLTPGFRIGYVATTNSKVIETFCTKKQAIDFSGILFIQKAFSEYLLTQSQANEFEQTISLFDKRRSTFIDEISKYGYAPDKHNIIINKSGFYISFEIPRNYHKKYPLEQFDEIVQKYPFIEKCINLDEYRGWFEERGYIPGSEIFVLDIISKTAINLLPGYLFCSVNKQIPNEYENWVRVALIQDENSINEAFKRIENYKDLLTW